MVLFKNSMAKRIYLFSFFFNFLVIIPVIVPLFGSLGLSMRQVFEVQAIFGLAVMFAEIPTGYLGDMWGRKKILLLGSFINAIGFTWLPFAQGYSGIVLFEVIVGVGMSFVSGSDISLLYETVSKPQQRKSLAGLQMASVSGEGVASVLASLLVLVALHSVTVANALTAWIPFLIALSFKEAPYEKMPSHGHLENFARVFRHIFAGPDRMLRMIFINLTVWSLATFFAVWLHQKYWEQIGIPLSAFGWLWAAFGIAAGLIGMQAHHWELRWGIRPLMIAQALLAIVAYFAMTCIVGPAGGLICFMFGASRGITQLLLRDAMNTRIPSGFRATANSISSFCFRLSFAICGPGIGYLIDRFSMTPALYVLGTVFLAAFAGLLIPLIRGMENETATTARN